MESAAESGAAPPGSNEPGRRRRRWLMPAAAVVFVLLVVGGFAAWRVSRVLPTGPTIGAVDATHLSPNDQQLLSQARRLGEQASAIGGSIGGLALSGDSEGVTNAGTKLADIGHQLIELSNRAQDPKVVDGLRQTGEGTQATGQGVLESSPSQVERGLALLKAGQATLETVADPGATP